MKNSGIIERISQYFDYKKNNILNSGYPARTPTARAMSGTSQCYMQRSIIPAGTYMSELSFIKYMNETELALMALESLQIETGKPYLEYIYLRYIEKKKKKDIAEKFGCTGATCYNYQCKALSFLDNFLSRAL